MEGRAVREVATELLSAWVESAPSAGAPTPKATPSGSDWLSEWSKLGERVERASVKPKAASAKRSVKTKALENENEGLVGRLRRDRK